MINSINTRSKDPTKHISFLFSFSCQEFFFFLPLQFCSSTDTALVSQELLYDDDKVTINDWTFIWSASNLWFWKHLDATRTQLKLDVKERSHFGDFYGGHEGHKTQWCCFFFFSFLKCRYVFWDVVVSECKKIKYNCAIWNVVFFYWYFVFSECVWGNIVLWPSGPPYVPL